MLTSDMVWLHTNPSRLYVGVCSTFATARRRLADISSSNRPNFDRLGKTPLNRFRVKIASDVEISPEIYESILQNSHVHIELSDYAIWKEVHADLGQSRWSR